MGAALRAHRRRAPGDRRRQDRQAPAARGRLGARRRRRSGGGPSATPATSRSRRRRGRGSRTSSRSTAAAPSCRGPTTPSWMAGRRHGTTSRRQRCDGLAFIALGAASVIRIVFVVVVAPKVPALGDASAYHLLAEHLAHGQGLHPAVRQPAAPHTTARPRSTRRSSRVCSSLPARGWARTPSNSNASSSRSSAPAPSRSSACSAAGVASPRVGLIAAALAAVYPMLFLGEATLMAESLYVALVTAVLLVRVPRVRRPEAGPLRRARRRDRARDADPRRRAAARHPGARSRSAGSCADLDSHASVWRGSRSRSASPLRSSRRGRSATRSGSTPSCRCRTTSRRSSTAPTATRPTAVRSSGSGARRSSQSGSQPAGADRCRRPRRASRASTSPIRTSTKRRRRAPTRAPASSTRAPSPRLAAEGRGGARPPHVGSVRAAATGRLRVARRPPARLADARHASCTGCSRRSRSRARIVLRRRRACSGRSLATAVTVTVVAAATYGQQRFRIAAEPAILVLAAAAIDSVVAGYGRGAGARVRSEARAGPLVRLVQCFGSSGRWSARS